jgi:hypothetical protein
MFTQAEALEKNTMSDLEKLHIGFSHEKTKQPADPD